MDQDMNVNAENKAVEQKLNRTTNRIKKLRKNSKIAQKEAAEFAEIHKLLENTENDCQIVTEGKPDSEVTNIKSLECSAIPLTLPGIKVFNEELLFSLFDEDSLCLKNFIQSKQELLIFGKDESILNEDCFRKLIAYHIAENLMPEEGKCSSISLYVLCLMSVHQDPAFVSACFDFLKIHTFQIESKDLHPIFVNFGIEPELFKSLKESLPYEKFHRNDGIVVEKRSQKYKFPFYNMEMVGKILLHYITKNSFKISSETKSLIQGLVKITLDPKIRSSSLLPLYSTILSSLCVQLKQRHKLKDIVALLHFKEEHLLNQLEICRIVSKPIFPDLHETLVLKTISSVLKSRDLPTKPPIKIDYIKTLIKRLIDKELPPLEFYSLLQLINDSLPGVIATVEDSIDINKSLTLLEKKTSQTEDSVDLIRLKLEIAKLRNLVANNINNRFTVDENVKNSPVGIIKCSN